MTIGLMKFASVTSEISQKNTGVMNLR